MRRLRQVLAGAAVAAVALAGAGSAMGGAIATPGATGSTPAYGAAAPGVWLPCAQSPQGKQWIAGGEWWLAEEGWQCTTVLRPLSRKRPIPGQNVTLPLVRHLATAGPDQKIATLFMNPGGPGQSGIGRHVDEQVLDRRRADHG